MPTGKASFIGISSRPDVFEQLVFEKIGIPGVGIAVSAIFLGFLVFLEARPPLALAALVVGFFAIFHAHVHGTELPQGASGILYSIGFVVATGSLHGVGIAIGLIHRWSWGRRPLRAGGGLVSIAGTTFLMRALA